jgi:hypothetical protein
MPAKDRHHDTVKRALIKDGWTITGEQIYLSDGARHVWIDLRAKRNDVETVILVEIKGFESNPSMVDAVMAAVGQYAFYQAMLQYLRRDERLILAVPLTAYDGIFQSPAAQQVVKNVGMQLLIFDPEAEEIVKWTP